ncbi:lipopolysaccharide biosynthesis protein [Pedobacter sp. Leaf41]|nr:Wzz/FepE/Etk N-terminal domain-containing protein [Pedobacter sp. Leaf41]KQN34093.1 lipopolysaccharide biosynthesis protein [Pedobacter sp. Leaf41]
MTTSSQDNINLDNSEITLKQVIMKFREWYRYLLSKWVIILIFILIGAGLGFLYSIMKKPIYTATTTFVLEDEKGGGGLGNLAGLASMAGVDLGGGGGGIFQGDNILGLYKSRTMLQETLLTPIEVSGKQQLLVDRYIEINDLRSKWEKTPKLIDVNFPLKNDQNGTLIPNRLRDSLLGSFINDLNKKYLNVTKPDKKLNIIQVDVKAPDEIFAKAFNDALVKNVNEFFINTKTKKAIQNVRILQHKTDSVRNVMNGAIYSAVAVADATPNLNPTRQVQRIAPSQKAQFSAETNKSVLGALLQNLELSKMGLLKETPLIQVIDQPIYPLSVSTFGKFKGLVIGGFIFFVVIILILIFRKIIRDITSETRVEV